MKYLVPLLALASPALANNVDIVGNVAAKCVIQTTKTGAYGNPTPDKLSTAVSDGGILPEIRIDVAIANSYTANITYPTSFTSSPSLSDTVAWTGSVAVSNTSDAGMSDYDSAKTVSGATTSYILTTAGSTWFAVSSTATYASSKPFTGGTYIAQMSASCIPS
jgi:hypothetical protein